MRSITICLAILLIPTILMGGPCMSKRHIPGAVSSEEDTVYSPTEIPEIEGVRNPASLGESERTCIATEMQKEGWVDSMSTRAQKQLDQDTPRDLVAIMNSQTLLTTTKRLCSFFEEGSSNQLTVEYEFNQSKNYQDVLLKAHAGVLSIHLRKDYDIELRAMSHSMFSQLKKATTHSTPPTQSHTPQDLGHDLGRGIYRILAYVEEEYFVQAETKKTEIIPCNRGYSLQSIEKAEEVQPIVRVLKDRELVISFNLDNNTFSITPISRSQGTV